MNRYIFILLTIIVLAGCAEDAIVSDLDFENLYLIKDDPNDPVKHKTYEIYTKYNVPVYFNDTIGIIKSGIDISGNPIYKYETLDLSWSFSHYDKAKYDFVYLIDKEQKLKSLDIVESYLENVKEALRPFSFLIVESAQRVDNTTGVINHFSNGDFGIYFRTVLLTGNFEGDNYLNIPETLKRDIILSKVTSLSDDLAYFNNITKAEMFGHKYWHVIDNTLENYWSCNALYSDWAGAKWYTEEQLTQMRLDARKVIGKFGFVKGSSSSLKGLVTPYDYNNDLINYVEEMLKYNKEEFEMLWGHSPLVMKKYDVLYDLIKNKLGVEL